jgi:hypothetical protein
MYRICLSLGNLYSMYLSVYFMRCASVLLLNRCMAKYHKRRAEICLNACASARHPTIIEAVWLANSSLLSSSQKTTAVTQQFFFLVCFHVEYFVFCIRLLFHSLSLLNGCESKRTSCSFIIINIVILLNICHI